MAILPHYHNFLTSEQKPGDFDLTKAVRETLIRAGASDSQLHAFDNSYDIKESQNKTTEIQLFLHKRFWIYQLITLDGVNTMEDRLLINQFNDPKTWFTYFANNVVDLAMTYNLPKNVGF